MTDRRLRTGSLALLALTACFSPASDTRSTGLDTGPGPESGEGSTSGGPEPGTSANETSAHAGTGPAATSGGEDGASSGAGSSSSAVATSDGASTGEPTAEYVMLFAAPAVNGDVRTAGGQATARASADALCAAEAEIQGHACPHTHAWLSIQPSDEIRDMPANYGVPTTLPIRGPNGALVDDDFDGLFDNEIALSFYAAGVFSDGLEFWTGANGEGGMSANDCAGWTTTDAPPPQGLGASGDADRTSDFVNWGAWGCATELPFVCVCW